MRRIISILFAVFIIASSVVVTPFTASAESLYTKKIVSLVYDDSTSMVSDRWVCANYALQSFCGMLNIGDELYVTYMSDCMKSDDIDLSNDKIQDEVDGIRNHSSAGATPFDSVKTAYNKLINVDNKDANTQYWLVVISDGGFNDVDNSGFEFEKLLLETREVNNGGKIESVKDFKKMPNGTNPHVVFLGIDGAPLPKLDVVDGRSTTTNNLISEMSSMASEVSGRVKMDSSKIKLSDDKKSVEINPGMPYLNVAVFGKDTDAKIVDDGVKFSGEGATPKILRTAKLESPEKLPEGVNGLITKSFSGTAYLIGDENKKMDGTLTLTFDKEVKTDDLDILYEPAIELRRVITVNGKEIPEDELGGITEGSKLSVSYELFEMGTDVKIDPKLLPKDTVYTVRVYENGEYEKPAREINVEKLDQMVLFDYELKNVETLIEADVDLKGMKIRSYISSFKPSVYMPTYTAKVDYKDNVTSIHIDSVPNNNELALIFTVFEDGTEITESSAVQALNLGIEASPNGNSGKVEYLDGKIIFTPNYASTASSNVGYYDVDVVCKNPNGDILASGGYSVKLAELGIVPADATKTVRKNELYGNTVSVSFEAYRDKGKIKLSKSDLEKISSPVVFNDKYTQLVYKDDYQDGVLLITPYDEKPHEVNFKTWWLNWWYYFHLPSEDIEVTLTCSYGKGTATIDIVEADFRYLILCVYLPLGLEILLIALLVAYVIRYFTKARFAPNAVLYVGSIDRSSKDIGTHRISLHEVPLKGYNTFFNLWNPFKELTVIADGISITAAKGGKIICNESFPWYSDMAKPKKSSIRIMSPKDIVEYCDEHDEMIIHEIKPTSVMDSQDSLVSQDDSVYYFINADIGYAKIGNKRMEVIESAVAFVYSTL